MFRLIPLRNALVPAAVVLLAAGQGLAADARISRVLDAMLERAESQVAAAANRSPEDVAVGSNESEALTTNPTSDPHGAIQRYRQYFAGTGQKRFAAGIRRLAPFKAAFENIFIEEGVPADLIWLGLVESGYDRWARSPKNAVGMWQFIPATATRFGLAVGRVDERTDPLKSARAAAQYLKFLYSTFGDWRLALAGYNAGEERVAEAIRRTGSRDFWRLSHLRLLPSETREYVPAVLAAQQLGAGSVLVARKSEVSGTGSPASVVYAQLGVMQ